MSVQLAAPLEPMHFATMAIELAMGRLGLSLCLLRLEYSFMTAL